SRITVSPLTSCDRASLEMEIFVAENSKLGAPGFKIQDKSFQCSMTLKIWLLTLLLLAKAYKNKKIVIYL
ncbi:MAG: hypothetical protein WBM38_05585, partial [Arenicellales bacterium]